MSGFLLDTNVLSELMRPRPDVKVTGWIAAQNIGTLFLSVVSIGKLESGLTTMRDTPRRARLEASLERHWRQLFPARVLPVTQPIAARWGKLDGTRQSLGQPLSTPDGMIAATALEHGLSLVTRNVKDFTGLGLAVLNPREISRCGHTSVCRLGLPIAVSNSPKKAKRFSIKPWCGWEPMIRMKR